MNRYRSHFISACPTNGAIINYELVIEIDRMIKVEDIDAATAMHPSAFHEDIADALVAALGGKQTLKATHHGHEIVTVRGVSGDELQRAVFAYVQAGKRGEDMAGAMRAAIEAAR